MYTIVYHEAVQNDLKKLGHRTAVLVLKKIQSIAQNPTIGKELGNKANLDLAGFRKIYVDRKKIRIVYRIEEAKIEIFIVAVGKRSDMDVYKKAATRK